jgi:hypothetical protein
VCEAFIANGNNTLAYKTWQSSCPLQMHHVCIFHCPVGLGEIAFSLEVHFSPLLTVSLIPPSTATLLFLDEATTSFTKRKFCTTIMDWE